MSVRLATLPSGLRVVTDSNPRLRTAAVGVFVAAGSRNEREQEHGLSHLLEHMAFKGTGKRNARQIAEAIENVGGDLNAETGVEQTGYFAHVLKEHAGLALDLLADIYCDSRFDPTELEREKNVIIQEIGSVEDAPDDLVFDHLSETAWAGQAIGRAILGTRETVGGFNRGAIGGYLRRHYRAGTTVVAAAGAVDHDDLVARAEIALAPLPSKAPPPPSPARYTGGERLTKKGLEQTHVVLAFSGLAVGEPDHDAAQAFAIAVGGGMSSPLFQEVREKRGLAYAVNAFHWSFADAGLFGVYAGSAPRHAGEWMAAALDTLNESAVRLDVAAVERAKAQMKVATLSVLESPGARAQQLARQLFAYGRVLGADEAIRRIARIDVAAAQRVGAAMLKTAPTVAAVGRVGKVWRADKVARRLAAA